MAMPAITSGITVPIAIVPHASEHSHAVEAFNQRMHDGGSKWGFYTSPVPDWLPYREGAPTWREYHLAIEDGDAVRGGFALKPQKWLINGKEEWVTDWQGPFTEAAINPRFSPLMLKLFRWMLKEHPLLFSLGHGGTEEPIVDLLRKMRWDLHGVPFCFRVLRPYRFLRFNRYLRETPGRRLGLDFLAYTGLGAIGIAALQFFSSMKARGGNAGVQAHEVESFGAWADELWSRHKDEYACLAIRDAEMMNSLMPPSGWPGGIRLRIDDGEETIGWSVVHHKRMTDDPRFGSLNVGLITDCFAATEHAASVINATHRFLAAKKLDLVYANLSHPDWILAVAKSGYIVLKDRRIFAMSPALQEKLEPFQHTRQGLHLTNMDGHGPHGFQ